ncbi:tyrosine-type recombinase/integrase [Actinomadura sp. 3N407]|uniref:tyrosine-type recombinase/integrase n=1 Tax=Actinomadura sp. 3N407 TaxID=3457423 RepID=UPI003FCC697F
MSSKSKPKRRSPGEGSVFEFKTKAGAVRFGIKFVVTQEDGSKKSVLRRRGPNGETWTKRTDAAKALRDAMTKVDTGTWVDPSKQPLGEYLDTWAAGLRLGDSTVASYKKNIRLHMTPYLGAIPLASLTTAKIDALYRTLEENGRRDGKGELTGTGLSARTVRYIHTILRSALQAAVDAEPALLAKNPADKAKPPTAKQAAPPEMHPWAAAQLRTFLNWSAEHSVHHVAWYVLAMTGMRRGELLALRWRDIDFDAGTIRVRRSVGLIRTKGKKPEIKEGDTKTSKPRTVDGDDHTMGMLRTLKRERGSLALQLARDDALVFGDAEGKHRHPERFSRAFKDQLKRCERYLTKQGRETLPEIRLHDLRHTHATLLLIGGEPVKVVSERLGHASAVITMNTYAHVLPGNQRAAADKFAALVAEA